MHAKAAVVSHHDIKAHLKEEESQLSITLEPLCVAPWLPYKNTQIFHDLSRFI